LIDSIYYGVTNGYVFPRRIGGTARRENRAASRRLHETKRSKSRARDEAKERTQREISLGIDWPKILIERGDNQGRAARALDRTSAGS
jgi:hypothetical protein